MPPAELSQLQNALLTWFVEHQRDLPWRKNYPAYGVWISEMMLQQTRVATVLDYYERWMKALPSIPSVAAADEATILKLWEGLGYYARARNIHRAAKQICEQHSGEFPNDYDAIRQLPGIQCRLGAFKGAVLGNTFTHLGLRENWKDGSDWQLC